MRVRGLIVASIGTVLAAAAVLAFSCVPAFAGTGYGFLTSFDVEQVVASSRHEDGGPLGVAVDASSGPSAGDVYVTDGTVVDKYTAAQAAAGSSKPVSRLTGFGETLGVTVNASNGDVYVTDAETATVREFDASGNPIVFTLSGVTVAAPVGIAVNAATGDVYVGDGATSTVYEFNASGVFTGNDYVVGTAAPVGVAVDSAGDVYVAEQYDGTLKFTAPGALAETVDSGISRGVAVDPAGDVFVIDYNQVAEYDSAGNTLGHPFGKADLENAGSGIALSAGPEPFVYVTEDGFNIFAGKHASVFDPGETPEEPRGEAAVDDDGGSAILKGQVNPGAGTGKGEYNFVYNTGGSCEGGSSAPVGEVEGNHKQVATEVTGLEPATTYTFCLVATNPYGSATSAPLSFTTPDVAVGNESALNATATTVDVTAEVDAGNAGGETTFQFEYGTSTAYGQSTPVSAPLGGERVAGAHIQGLAPGTTYHYRVVLVNLHTPAGGIAGRDETFTTQGTGGPLSLLDGREWELVSPPNKHGAGIQPPQEEGGAIQASANGTAITYISLGPVGSEATAPTSRNPEFQQVYSKRGTNGWETHDIAAPHNKVTAFAVGQGAEYRLFSEDLSLGVLEPRGETLLSPAASEPTPYLRNTNVNPCALAETTCYIPLATGKEGYANIPPGTELFRHNANQGQEAYLSQVSFRGASPDLRHEILSSAVPLIGGLGAGLYEWNAGVPPSEQLQPMSVLPASEGGGVVGAPPDGSGLAGEGTGKGYWPLTDNGSYFFSAGGHIYIHDPEKNESFRLDIAHGVAEPAYGHAAYIRASRDGSRLLFSDTERLTSAPVTEAVGGGIYECRIVEVAGKLTCGQLELTDLTSSDVSGIFLGESEDLSYLYFAQGPLHEADRGQGHKLYVDHYDGMRWTRTFIAVLSENDAPDWSGAEEVSRARFSRMTSRVSPNGRFLAFMSERSLTGYDNRDAHSGVPDEEVYEYDAQTGSLSCASCNPDGARPNGILDTHQSLGEHTRSIVADYQHVWTGRWLAGNIPSWIAWELYGTYYQTRYLSSEGRLFFNSPDGLVSQDINGLEDVYEYEPPRVGGTAGCSPSSATFSKQDGGCVGSMSSGTSNEESSFLDASGKGPGGEEAEDVFFMTAGKLVPEDYDQSFDVYDAHVCSSGAPCPAPVVAPPPCTTADSCRAALSPQPAIFGAPPSATFSGAGNAPPVESNATGPRSKPLTRARKLRGALKACRRLAKHRRGACEVRARRRYGANAKRSGVSTRRGK
jgi:DNA-binding beta-propeller fold protein YncE